MEQTKANVIIPENFNKPPEQHEIETAWIIAHHYNQVIEFLKPIDDYHRSTPDIIMGGQLWEMKRPMGKSRLNIERQIKRALKQSPNIIIDGRSLNTADDILERKLHYVTTHHQSVRKLLFITKEKNVVEIVWK
jgi:hypothetical protein